MVNLQDLPDEILLRVLDLLKAGKYVYSYRSDHRKACWSLSLTSKSLSPLAQTALFHAVTLNHNERRTEAFTRTMKEEAHLAEKVRILDAALVYSPSQQAAIRTCLALCKNVLEVHFAHAKSLDTYSDLLEADQIMKLGVGTRGLGSAAYHDIILADLPTRIIPQLEVWFEGYYHFTNKPKPKDDVRKAREPSGKLNAGTLQLGNLGYGMTIAGSEYIVDWQKIRAIRADEVLVGKVLGRFSSPQVLRLSFCAITPHTLEGLSSHLAANVTHLRLERIQVYTPEEMVRDGLSFFPRHMRPAPLLTFPLSSFPKLEILEMGSVLPKVSDPPATLKTIRLLEVSATTIASLHSMLSSPHLAPSVHLSLLGPTEIKWEGECTQRAARAKLAEEVDELCVLRGVLSTMTPLRQLRDKRDNR